MDEEVYSKHVEELRKEIFSSRQERKRKRELEKITDPEAAAARRLKRNKQKGNSRKRKMEDLRSGLIDGQCSEWNISLHGVSLRFFLAFFEPQSWHKATIETHGHCRGLDLEVYNCNTIYAYIYRPAYRSPPLIIKIKIKIFNEPFYFSFIIIIIIIIINKLLYFFYTHH